MKAWDLDFSNIMSKSKNNAALIQQRSGFLSKILNHTYKTTLTPS
jgi:hypothetical protein